MSKKHDDQEQDDSLAKNQEEHEEASEKSTETILQKNRGDLIKIGFGIVVFVVIIIAAICSLSWYRKHSDNTAQIQASNRQYLQIKSQLDQLEQHNNAMQQQLNTLHTTITQQTKDINFTKSASSRLESELVGKKMGWLLNEALYLTRLANYNLTYQHDISTSIVLLEDADQALFATGNPDVSNVRKMMADNITHLQTIPKVDMTGIFLRLNALDNEIKKLPLLAENPASEKLSAAQKSHKKNDNWKSSLKKNVHSIGQLIIIQRRDKPVEPLISPEQETLLNLYLSNLFANAQWAVLHGSNTIYQTSLTQIKQTVSRYYSTTSDSTLQLLNSIDTLTKHNLSPTLPNVSVTVKVLTQLSDRLDEPVSNQEVSKGQ